MRRVCLDLTGTLPRVSRVREFLADESVDKRARLIDELLASPRFAAHLATTWRRIILPRGLEAEQVNSAVALERWLRTRIMERDRYDNIVADVLVATGSSRGGPAAFYSSADLKPEELAASTSRVFLGMQIQCAQCHDHPFDNWSQEDFWGFAAFFARVRRLEQGQAQANLRLVDLDSGEVVLPETETIIAPKYPAGQTANPADGGTRRRQLAIWMASRDNPYFARAAVNRMWALLFGRGLIDPVDDLGEFNPPSHPELLDELEAFFVESGFDLAALLRVLANTKAYQLSSAAPQGDAAPPELFARMAVKPLSAEQLYDSIAAISGRASAVPNAGMAAEPLLDPSRRAFLTKIASSNGASVADIGVPQALVLMNGAESATATNSAQGGLLQAIEAPLFSDRERVEILCLATLSRPPHPHEYDALLAHVVEGAASGKRHEALGDVLWALMNSSEFALNH